jgi:hypothetical protein
MGTPNQSGLVRNEQGTVLIISVNQTRYAHRGFHSLIADGRLWHFYRITFQLKIVPTAPFNLNLINHLSSSSKFNLPNLTVSFISSESSWNSVGGCSHPSSGPGPDNQAETADAINVKMVNEMGSPLCRMQDSTPDTVSAFFY